MRKRLLSWTLILVLLLSLLPMTAAAAEDDTELRALITKQYDAYAAGLYQKDAHNAAVKQMLTHSLTHPNQDLYLGEQDGFTASLFHTNLFRLYMIDALTIGTQMMQTQHLSEALVGSYNLGWHTHALKYEISTWDINTKNPEKAQNPGNLITDVIEYHGERNQNDKAMILLAGGIGSAMRITRTASDLEHVSYHVELAIADSFDFDNDYSTEIKDGYDVSTSILITSLGSKTLNPFDWTINVDFDITVPNTCDHTPNSYRWARSGNALVSANGDIWVNNPAKRNKYENSPTDVRYFYTLQHPISLRHDMPWSVEFRIDGNNSLILAPNSWYAYDGDHHLLKDSSRVAGSVAYNLPIGDQTIEKPLRDKGRHQYGINFADKGFDPTQTHTYRMENRIQADGSNMIYLLVDGVELGAMTEYSVYYDKTQKVKEFGTEDTRLNGMDFYFNYVYNNSIFCRDTLPLEYLEIREAGTDPNLFITHYPAEATCTQPAADVWHCTACDAKAYTPTAPALGHSFGEYTYDNNASCTADGTRTRKCTVCGEIERAIAPDTATGHSHQPAVTAPTCTAQGYTTYTCHCGDKYVTDYTEAMGHNYRTDIIAPTCTEQGYTVYTCHCGDTYKADYTDAEGHSPVIDLAVPASCIGNGLTEGSHCEVCGYVIKAQNTVIGGTHLKDEGTIIKEATYETPGTVMYQCIYCGEKSYVVLPKLDKPEPVVNPFTDVKESDWFYNPVMWAVQSGVTGGKTATTFAPNEGCTRAQVVTFLWAANGKPMPKSAENPFTDIKEGDWYYNAVLWAVENGITGGTSEHTFSPNATCTRAQIATFLWAAQGKHAVGNLSGFSDVAAADWYATPVIWAKEQGITDGIGDGKFGPNDTCTRAQVVTFLNKVYG